MQNKIYSMLSIMSLILFTLVILFENVSAQPNHTFETFEINDKNDTMLNLQTDSKNDLITFDEGGFFNPPDVEILKSDLESIVVKVDLHGIKLERKRIGKETFQILTLPEYGFTTEVGKPQLPVVRILLAIPHSGQVAMKILNANYSSLQNYNIYPTQEPTLDIPKSAENNFTINKTFYLSNHFYPNKIADVSPPKELREYRIVQLQIYPIWFNPTSKELKIYEEIRIKLEFSDVEKCNTGVISKNLFGKIYEKTILNYNLAKEYSTITVAEDPYIPSAKPLPSGENE